MKLSQNFSKQGAALNFANETNAQRSADLCAVKRELLQKILTVSQMFGGIGILGIVGGIDRGQPMWNVRYIFILGLVLIGLEILKQAITAIKITKACSERAFRTRKAYRVGKHQTVR